MSMNVGPADGGEDAVMSDINTTPLVDVMLVLLIIFLITIPVVTTRHQARSAERARGAARDQAGKHRHLGGHAEQHLLYDARIKNVNELVDKLKKVSAKKPQPEVQIRGDLTAQYEGVGKVLYACQRAGITKVAFITEPPPLGG